LGCKHYRRSNKLKANCCGGWFTCRFCHDEASDHQIVRNETKVMMCMYCQAVQPAAKRCANESCGKEMARYFCPQCVLWDDTPAKSIYHCSDCGICRVGEGLDIDYFHCDKCNVCMAIELKNQHKCIERNLESDCPICGEYMFTSTTTVIFMPCGHCIHYACHRKYIRTSYQCPTCLKSLGDMTQYFQSLDALMESQQMPPQYENDRSVILCNDCEQKSIAKYHFLYHKC
ncbi:zf-CHY-domain-containing protein, partial [Basidiobolus meristosporus CBS 931.73]